MFEDFVCGSRVEEFHKENIFFDCFGNFVAFFQLDKARIYIQGNFRKTEKLNEATLPE